jgi:hypothetical protein
VFEDDVSVAAGWYPDPMGLPQLRWWNNHAWTELTTEARPPLVMQQPTVPQPTRLLYADDELPTRRQQREQRQREAEVARLATAEGDARDIATPHAPLTTTLREIDAPAAVDQAAGSISPIDPGGTESISTRTSSIDTGSVDSSGIHTGSIDTAAIDRDQLDEGDSGITETFDGAYQPRSATSAVSAPTAQHERTKAQEPEPTPARSTALPRFAIYTGPVWIIALLPLLQLVVGLLVLVGFGAIANSAYAIVAVAGPYIAVIVLAIADRAILTRAGHERTAHWAWALLTAPVYLIARSMALSRTGALGLGPLLVWAALGMLQVASILVVPGMLISVLPTAFSMQADQSIASEATIVGAKLTVDCPTPPALLIGQTFDCNATTAAGNTYKITASLQRANGWIDWRVDDWGSYTLSR